MYTNMNSNVNSNMNSNVNSKETKQPINFEYLLLIVCTIVSIISQFPYLQDNSIIRIVLITIWIATLVVSIVRNGIVLNSKVLWMIGLLMIFNIFIMSMDMISGGLYLETPHFRNTNLAMFIFIIGFTAANAISEEGIKKICLIYIISVLALMINVYQTGFSGLNILDIETIWFGSKNSLGPIILSALILLLILFEPNRGIIKFFRLMISIVMIIFLTMLMNRAGMVAGILVFMYYLLFSTKLKGKKLKLLLITLFCISIIMMNDTLFQYIMQVTRIDQVFIYGDIDNFSAGRMELNARAWESFLNKPLFGNGVFFTESFQLSVLVNYGVIGGGIVLLMSIIPVIEFAVKKRFSNNRVVIATTLLIVLTFVISFFEEQAPFGPGVRSFIMWLLAGYCMANEAKLEGNEEGVNHDEG